MPIARVQLPDGKIGRFEVPDGTSPQDAERMALDEYRKMQEATPPAAADLANAPTLQPGPPSARDQGVGLGDQVAQGMLFNYGDEVSAAARYGADYLTDKLGIRPKRYPAYLDALKQVQGEQSAYRQEHPVLSTIGNIAGGAVLAGGLNRGGLTLMNAAKPTIGSMAGRGAAEGALYGAAYGSGEGNGLADRAAKAAEGAVAGAATGGVIGAATGALARSTTPTLDALTKRANAAYDVADKSGVNILPQSMKQFAATLPDKLDNAGFDPILHPRVNRAIEVLTERSDAPMTISQADRMRRIMKNAAASPDKSERSVARTLVNAFDDYISKLGQGDVVGGSVADAQALNEARNLWARKSKAEIVDTLIERARNRSSQFSGSGYENALRTEFRNLVQNESRLRLFSKTEQEALKKVANGGPLTNVMRFIGKAAPRGVVSTGFGVGAGAVTGNPLVTGGVMMAGEAGRMGATAATARNARLAQELMRAGGQIAPRSLSPQSRAIAEALLVTGSQQGARLPAMISTGQK